jgi:electron transport complex protein RnfG
MKEKIMPPLVLMLISVIVCGLLVVANEATKDKVVKAQENKFQVALSETFGEADYNISDLSYDGIQSVTTDEKGRVIFEIIADGYAKGGLNLLIGMDESGKVCGISFLSIGETPGLGTKVKEQKSFIEQFMGASDDSYEFEVITGATYSSKGMKSAVDLALKTYNEHKEEILNG